MYSLVVFENGVEALDLFLIPNDKIDDKTKQHLELASGKYINSDNDNDSIFIIEHMLFDYEIEVDEDNPPYTGEFTKYKIEDPKILNTNITNVYTMGMLP